MPPRLEKEKKPLDRIFHGKGACRGGVARGSRRNPCVGIDPRERQMENHRGIATAPSPIFPHAKKNERTREQL